MLLQTQNITKHYINHTALSNVSISIPAQTIYGLLGPNGAGKTTLIRTINQTILQDEGKIYFDGKPLQAHHTTQIGYLPEERGLYKKMKVKEQVLYLAQLKGLSQQKAIQQLNYWTKKLGVEKWHNKRIEQLSKGMQQKIQFIVTILHQPKLIILDEPFTGFDPLNTEIIIKEILELRDKGATIILSTHNMNSVEALCDKIALINKSKKVLESNVPDLKQQYKTNTYLLQYSNDTQDVKKLLSKSYQVLNEQANTLHVKIPDNSTPNHLIKKLITNNIQINTYKEILPTMNDIFIKTIFNN